MKASAAVSSNHRFIPSRRKWTSDVIAFNILGYVLLIAFALLCFLPFYLVVVSSFELEDNLVKEGFMLYIRDFSLESYKMSLKNPENILRAYGVTTLVTLVGTAGSLLLCTMTGYVLSRSISGHVTSSRFSSSSQRCSQAAWYRGTSSVCAT